MRSRRSLPSTLAHCGRFSLKISPRVAYPETDSRHTGSSSAAFHAAALPDAGIDMHMHHLADHNAAVANRYDGHQVGLQMRFPPLSRAADAPCWTAPVLYPPRRIRPRRRGNRSR